MDDKLIRTGAEASRNLLEYGVLGTLVIILSVALVFALRALLKAKNDHLEDKDRVGKALREQAVRSQALVSQTTTVIDSLSMKIDAQDSTLQKLGKRMDALALSVPGCNVEKYLQAKGGS